MKTEYKVPKCHFCNEELTSVLTQECYTWNFVPAEGMYEAHFAPDEVYINCPTCGDNVSKELGDNISSYQAPKVEEQQPTNQESNYGVEKTGEAPAF